jgi:hypothetical protein
MIFESTLTRQEFTRHALTRHFRRPVFYVFVTVCALLTAYGVLTPEAPWLVYLAAWLPLLVYGIGGWIMVTRRARDESLPLYLPTRYEFTKGGVELSSRQGRSSFTWADFRAWRKVTGLYELGLTNGQLLVISAQAVPPRQIAGFEELLNKQIQPKPEIGVFDA